MVVFEEKYSKIKLACSCQCSIQIWAGQLVREDLYPTLWEHSLWTDSEHLGGCLTKGQISQAPGLSPRYLSGWRRWVQELGPLLQNPASWPLTESVTPHFHIWHQQLSVPLYLLAFKFCHHILYPLVSLQVSFFLFKHWRLQQILGPWTNGSNSQTRTSNWQEKFQLHSYMELPK